MRIKSRPISERAMRLFTKKVVERKQHQYARPLPRGEDAFPSRLRPNPVVPTTSTEQRPARPRGSAESVIKNNLPIIPKVLASGNAIVTCNNNNHGKLFINGKPFWVRSTKQDEDEKTDDDLPLNADVVLDVYSKKITLVSMPTITVSMDPYNEMRHMIAKDNLFFTKEILFGNTVRTMINANDTGPGTLDSTIPSSQHNSVEKEIEKEKQRKKNKTTKVKLHEPHSMLYYSNSNMSKCRRQSLSIKEKKNPKKISKQENSDR